jgi:hypothetical protein
VTGEVETVTRLACPSCGMTAPRCAAKRRAWRESNGVPAACCLRCKHPAAPCDRQGSDR